MDIRFAEKISDHISEYMYQNQIVDADELQVCKYNLQVFFERTVTFLSLVAGSEILLGLFSLVTMVLIGSVNHPDMNWSCSEFSVAKRWSRAIAIIVFVITIALTMTEVTNTYSAYTAVGSAFAAASLLIAKTIELWNRFLAP